MARALVSLCIVLSLLLQSSNALAPESRGTDFFVAFAFNLGTPKLELYISADFANTVIVTSKTAVLATLNIPAGTTTNFVVSSYIIPSLNSVGTMGLRVYSPSNSTFTLAGINTVTATTDAFLGFPVHILGTEYVVASYTSISSTSSYIYVVAPSDGTTVTFSGPRTLTGQSSGTVTYSLNSFQTVAVGITNGDITGFKVSSNKPIAVFGGSQCVNVPVGTTACNLIVDQMPPINTWDVTHITVPLATRTAGDIIRVTSAYAGTQVKVNGAVKTTLAAQTWYEFSATTASYIETSLPALVTQYCKGSSADGKSADPFMLWIPPVNQYASNYYVTAPTGTYWSNYVSIVIESGTQTGLTLDSVAIPNSGWVTIAGSSYIYKAINVAGGSHWVSHSSPIQPFNVMIYGYGSYDGYGYVGGSRLSPLNSPCTVTATQPGDGIDNDCDGRVDEEIRNGIDDDNDGRIDEDLAVDTCCYSNNQQPTLTMSGASTANVGISCGAAIPPLATGTASNLACTNVTTQTVTPVITVTPGACPDGSVIKRVWTAYDECGRSVSVTQIITITSVCGNGIIESPEQCDGGACCSSSCTYQSSATTCRGSNGVCDVAETCTGSSATCPADTFQSSSTVCRNSNGDCDVAETCSGSGASCPADSYKAFNTPCRASSGVCDVAEVCTGTGASCPADSFQSSSTTCRASNGPCDVAEQCTGSSGSCPSDTFVASGTTCRSSNGICDVAEQCTGSTAACPADSFQSSSTVCRASNGVCDVAETCSGSGSSCPADSFQSSATTCRSSNGPCDVAEQCTGSSSSCPADSFQSSATTCRVSNGVCDVAEQCTGSAAACPADSFQSSATTCRASNGPCDVAEQCTGFGSSCPADSFQSSATTCRVSNGVCDVAEQCTGTGASCPADSFQSSATTCRASNGVCDVAEQCTGNGASCPADSFQSSATTCRSSNGICDVAEQCTGTGASCPADSFQSSATTCRPTNGPCDVAEQCTGTGASCPADSFEASSTVCRASNGICDSIETCTGFGPGCPADSFEPTSVTCRASNGVCDVAEQCTGNGASCPADSFQSSATTCRSSNGPCDVSEQCTGTGASCPADSFQSSTTVCRASAGICDTTEQCTGSDAACPADSFVPSTTTCRASAGICDVSEQCTGSDASCPSDAFVSSTTTCRASNGICDVAEQCTGTGASCPTDVFQPSTTTCRSSAGICDVVEQCTGSAAACPADGFASSTVTCRSSIGACDASEQCTGTGVTCPADINGAWESDCIGLEFVVPGQSTSFLGYDVISFNNFVGSTGNVEGRVAVKNNLSVGNGWSVGSSTGNQAGDTFVKYAIVAGGSVSWASGEIYPHNKQTVLGPVTENLFAGGAVTGADYILDRLAGNCSTPGCLAQEFDDARLCYAAYQNAYAAKANNVQKVIQWSGLTLTCDSPNAREYVVTLSPAEMSQYTYVTLSNCASSARWIVNIDGTSNVVLNGVTITTDGSVIYNILGSGRTISVGWIQVIGSILSPYNTLDQTGGSITGKVVVGDVTKSLNFIRYSCYAL